LLRTVNFHVNSPFLQTCHCSDSDKILGILCSPPAGRESNP